MCKDEMDRKHLNFKCNKITTYILVCVLEKNFEFGTWLNIMLKDILYIDIYFYMVIKTSKKYSCDNCYP